MIRFFAVLLLLVSCTHIEGATFPDPVVKDPHWLAAVPAQYNRRTIDHTLWDGFLKTHIMHDENGNTRLDYAVLSNADLEPLRNYITAMQDVTITTYPRQQQLAYWLNLYNALLVAYTIDHYPFEFIRNQDKIGFMGHGPWSNPIVMVEKKPLSLNDIYHTIIRPIFKEPRIHYALTSLELGGPDLQPFAYDPQILDKQLTTAARAYVNAPKAIQFSEQNDLFVAKLYGWFAEDFGGNAPAIINHLKKYADEDINAQLKDHIIIKGYLNYNWYLNDPRNEG